MFFALLFSYLFYQGYFFEYYGIENRFLDRRFILRGKIPCDDNIVIVTILDKCIEELGAWPWPRSIYAKVLSILKKAGAKIIAFDIMFSEQSIYGEEDDKIFADAIKESGNVILPIAFLNKTILNEEFEIKQKVVLTPPLKIFRENALGEGFIDIDHKTINLDGVIRQVFLFRELDGKNFPILGLEVAAKYLGFPAVPEKTGVMIGSKYCPLFLRNELTTSANPVSSFILNYLGPTEHFKEISFSDLYNRPESIGNFDTLFRGKIVLIGSRARGAAEDIKFSPFGAIAGMETHANLIQNIISSQFLYRFPPVISTLMIVSMAIITAWLLWWKPASWMANLLIVFLWFGYLGSSVVLFFRNIILEISPILFMVPIQTAVMNLIRQFLDLRERNRELAKKVRELSIVNEVSQAVSYMGNLNKTLDTILSRAVIALGAERGSILLLDERYENLVEESVIYGIEGPVQFDPEKKAQFKTGEGIAGEVFTTGKPKLVHDISRDKDFKPSSSNIQKPRSLVCVPLQIRDAPIGVMNIVNKSEGQFDHEDLQLALTMANQAAVVIEKARLFNLATIDGLTGLIVHRHFQSKMEEEFRRAKRYEKPLSFIMTDIDHFKKFNDTWGHQTGDMVLREVAKCVRTSIRDTDVAARYGGEEFAIILPETDAEGALLFAERLRQKVENSVFNGPKGELRVTISLGVSSFPRNPVESTSEMIKLADEALYEAKRSGRNQVKISTYEGAEMAS